jgi:hypothetical protein
MKLRHTSLDAGNAAAAGWIAAQIADSGFISTYARDNPQREDIAESFLPYLAVRYRSDRITQGLKDTIDQTIPHRIAYFDGLGLAMYPFTTTGVTENFGVPEKFSLGQNYPNPFNPMTTITFSITVGTYGRTSLRVYDLLGREVAVLVNERKEPGSYRVQFDARNLASGVYFYRLITGDFVAVKRMMLIR